MVLAVFFLRYIRPASIDAVNSRIIQAGNSGIESEGNEVGETVSKGVDVVLGLIVGLGEGVADVVLGEDDGVGEREADGDIIGEDILIASVLSWVYISFSLPAQPSACNPPMANKVLLNDVSAKMSR